MPSVGPEDYRDNKPRKPDYGHASHFPPKSLGPRPKARVTAAQFAQGAINRLAAGTRESYAPPARPIVKRGYAAGGIAALAPVYVKSSDRFKAPHEEHMADFGHATDRLDAALMDYRRMDREERAEWLASKLEAPYIPPMVKVLPRLYAAGSYRAIVTRPLPAMWPR